VTFEIMRAGDRPATPWRNGGGVTREVATDGASPFRWRVSLADVAADGPFSPFPGYRRIITVVRGAGMRLVVDGAPTVVPRYRPFAFPGDAVTTCELLDGPVMDLNAISVDEASVRVVAMSAPLAVPLGALVVVLEGTASVRATGAVLGEFDAARAPSPWHLDPAPRAVAALIDPARQPGG
jgi:environmental stress-induced protein Ves